MSISYIKKFKPTRYTNPSKGGIDRFISNVYRVGFVDIGCSGYGYVSDDDKYIYLYNCEKHRKRVKVTKKVQKNQYGRSYKREVVSHKEWVYYVYKIPLNIVKTAKQHSRTFELEFK